MLHGGMEVECQDHDRPPRSILSEVRRRKLPAGEVLFHHGVSFFRFAASLTMPANECASFPVHVGHHPEELVLGLIEGDGLKRKAVHTGEVGLLHHFPDGYIAVGLPLLGRGTFARDEADFSPFPADVSFLVEEGTPRFCLADCFFELGSDVAAYGEFDPAEAGMFVFVIAIPQQIVLISCRIRAEPDGRYLLGQQGKGMDEYAPLFVSRRDVPVPELRVEDESLLRPVGIQGLVGFEPLIGEKGMLLLCCDEGCVHVEGSQAGGIAFQDGGNEIGIDPFKGRQELGRRRDRSAPCGILVSPRW